MIYPFAERGFLGRALKLDEDDHMRGNDVIAWQYHLGVRADGDFGQRTHEGTLVFQRTAGLKEDGIVGPATFQAGCLHHIDVMGGGVVAGLPRGMVEGESGYWMGAQSPVYFRNGERRADLGLVQFSTLLSDEAAVRRALNVPEAVLRLCEFLREGQAQYRRGAFVKFHRAPERLSWWLACGRWNAPAWTDIWAERGPDTAELQKLVTSPMGTLITREQWVRNYVASKIAYVEDWTL
jgi:hypothetical protein